MTNASILSILAHATPTPTSTSKGQKSKSRCKGVRCPPIFSLSNLINVGWLVRKCVNISIHPLIVGTNRKTYLLHASFALKDRHC